MIFDQMKNAAEEFDEFVNLCTEGSDWGLPNPVTLVCADIESRNGSHLLKVGYTKEDYQNFLKGLDFDYDSGYGTQEIRGTIWFSDGSWGQRQEYDGSEWWEKEVKPEIPNYLKNKN